MQVSNKENVDARFRSVSSEAVLAQLQKILATSPFNSSRRLSTFLRYVTEETVRGLEQYIKEYSLGITVFQKGASFDPRLDPVVRVTAGRVRSKLKEYYAGEGRADKIFIGLPKGRYVPVFGENAFLPSPKATILHSVRPLDVAGTETPMVATRSLRVGGSLAPLMRRSNPRCGTQVEQRRKCTFCVLGRYYCDRLRPSDINKAFGCFETAMSGRPVCPVAYAGIAECWILLSICNVSRPRDAMPNAKAAATKALQMDGGLAEAHCVGGLIKAVYDWDWDGAEREFTRAISLNPCHSPTRRWYALTCLASTGRLKEALAQIERAVELDPLSAVTRSIFGDILQRSGRHDEAINQYETVLVFDPSFFWAYRNLGLVLARKGLFHEAMTVLQKAETISQGNSAITGTLGYIYALSGKRKLAQQLLDRLKKGALERYIPPYHLTALYAGLGMKKEAFGSLDRALQDRSAWLNGAKVDPSLRALKSEPRFKALINKLGLTA